MNNIQYITNITNENTSEEKIDAVLKVLLPNTNINYTSRIQNQYHTYMRTHILYIVLLCILLPYIIMYRMFIIYKHYIIYRKNIHNI